jgi:hypothetical protein
METSNILSARKAILSLLACTLVCHLTTRTDTSNPATPLIAPIVPNIFSTLSSCSAKRNFTIAYRGVIGKEQAVFCQVCGIFGQQF